MILNNFFSEKVEDQRKQQQQQQQQYHPQFSKGSKPTKVETYVKNYSVSQSSQRFKEKSLNKLLGLKSESAADKYFAMAAKSNRHSLLETYNHLDDQQLLQQQQQQLKPPAKVIPDGNDSKFSRTSSKNFLLQNYQGGIAHKLRNEGKAAQSVKQSVVNHWAIVQGDKTTLGGSYSSSNHNTQSSLKSSFIMKPGQNNSPSNQQNQQFERSHSQRLYSQETSLLPGQNSFSFVGVSTNIPDASSSHLVDNTSTTINSAKGFVDNSNKPTNNFNNESNQHPSTPTDALSSVPNYAMGTIVSNNKTNQARRFSRARPVTAASSKNSFSMSSAGMNNYGLNNNTEFPEEQYISGQDYQSVNSKPWMRYDLLQNKQRGELIDEFEEGGSIPEIDWIKKDKMKRNSVDETEDTQNCKGIDLEQLTGKAHQKIACSVIIQECESLLNKIQKRDNIQLYNSTKKENALFGAAPSGNIMNMSSGSQKNILGRSACGQLRQFDSSKRPQSVKRESASMKHLGVRDKLIREQDGEEEGDGYDDDELDDDTMAIQKIANNLLLRKIGKDTKAIQESLGIQQAATPTTTTLDYTSATRSLAKSKTFSQTSSGKFYSKDESKSANKHKESTDKSTQLIKNISGQKNNQKKFEFYSDQNELSRIQEQQQEHQQVVGQDDECQDEKEEKVQQQSSYMAELSVNNHKKLDNTKRLSSTATPSKRFYDIRERGQLAEKKEKLALEGQRSATIIAKNVQKFSGQLAEGVGLNNLLSRPESKRQTSLAYFDNKEINESSTARNNYYSQRRSELSNNQQGQESKKQGIDNVNLENKRSSIRPATAAPMQANQSKNTNTTKDTNNSGMTRYEIKSTIGKGSYAIVKLASDSLSSKEVAIKMYDKYKLIDPQKRNNVKREVAILSKMDHANIIKLYQTLDTRATVNLVMEYISSVSLRHFMKGLDGKQLDEKYSKIIFKQLANAVSYCHDTDVIHRDIKLENIMLHTENNYNIKLIDFGFAIRMPSEKKLNIFCGTPSYMSPEITRKKEYFGKPADVWSLGVVLFALVCSRFPFKGKDDAELFKKIQSGEYRVSSGASPSAAALIHKLLRQNPNERPTAREILQDRWITDG